MIFQSFCRTAPEAVILEIETNDLSHNGPEVVGSDIEDLSEAMILAVMNAFFAIA